MSGRSFTIVRISIERFRIYDAEADRTFLPRISQMLLAYLVTLSYFASSHKPALTNVLPSPTKIIETVFRNFLFRVLAHIRDECMKSGPPTAALPLLFFHIIIPWFAHRP